MAKSRDAFRTISEVSEALDTPAHVLRFWESKFKQIKPVKRAGGRRYYRPDDLALLASIKDLLHEQGHSIKNAQKLIRDTGVKDVVAQGHALLGSDDAGDTIDAPTMPPRAVPPKMQPDLFAGSDLPEQSAPRIEIVEAEALLDAEPSASPELSATIEVEAPAAAPETKSALAQSLPQEPVSRDVPSRILEALGRADPDKVRAQTAKIAPLANRLAALRDEMRHPW